METIGFTNFRNFKEFKTLPLEGVTFLVGPNNSGKSSITKACRLFAENVANTLQSSDYIQEMSDWVLGSFGKFNVTNVCKSFARAKNVAASDREDMSFHSRCGYFDISIVPSKNGRIQELRVYDIIDDCTWVCPKPTSAYNERKEHGRTHADYNYLEYSNKLIQNILRYVLKTKKGLSEKYIAKLNDIIKDLEKDKTKHRIENSGSWDFIPFRFRLGTYLILENNGCPVNQLQNEVDLPDEFKQFDGDEYVSHYKIIDSANLIEVDNFFKRIANDYECAVFDMSQRLFYMHAFDYEIQSSFRVDAKDDVSQIIKDFYKKHYRDEWKKCSSYDVDGLDPYEYFLMTKLAGKIPKDIKEKRDAFIDGSGQWIKEWMCNLGIGKDFEIRSTNDGEILSVRIKNMSDQWIPLSDLGRGVSQLFLLLLRIVFAIPFDYFDDSPIATQMRVEMDSYPENVHEAALYKQEKEDAEFPDGYKRYSMSKKDQILFIVEEPEQNLHPALQSKLADLFLEVYKKFGINVLVETHSEYLIRKTQVLVAQQNKQADKSSVDSPFKVYYIPQPEDGKPYEMEYLPNGAFSNSFGAGFYDEASLLSFQVLTA